MKNPEAPEDCPFGTLLGVAPGGVEAYCSDYDTADEALLPDRKAYRSYVDGLYMGYKWQCVEFARRWMYINRGLVFDDVAMAYEIFRLRTIRDVRQQQMLPLRAFRNGSRRHPEPGCLLIWSEGGEFARTGHVAIITEVLADRVRLAEQNVEFHRWPEGCEYSREIPARVGSDGSFWLRCSFHDASILGWVMQTGDDEHAVLPEQLDPALFRVASDRLAPSASPPMSWLNEANPDERAFVEMMGGHRAVARPANEGLYYVISETALAELRRATNELHAMFLHATELALKDEGILEKFNLPRALWPRIRQSWNNRRNQTISGRFDFAMTPEGLKVYEYNCDSASCHMDAAKVQGRWAESHGCEIGRDPGQRLLSDLCAAWRESEVDGVVHIMIDDDPEERYHALFMQEVFVAAGIEARLVEGVSGLAWGDGDTIVDAEGTPIRWVWKTWAWETAFDEIRAEIDVDEESSTIATGHRHAGPPRLVDVLLHPTVMVFEPLWTVIPSNKAILPVLWSLFPEQRYLLSAAFELTDELRASGYVSKPIVGRCGANITLFDANDRVVVETAGNFDHHDQIYQALFALPEEGGNRVQLCTFTAGGSYAGACVRADPSIIVTADSDVVPLRIVDDRSFRRDFDGDEASLLTAATNSAT